MIGGSLSDRIPQVNVLVTSDSKTTCAHGSSTNIPFKSGVIFYGSRLHTKA